MKLREYLKEYKLITDGSFGTYFTDRYHTQEMPERANLVHGEWVEEIHKAYIEAGARLIRTNTFAANTVLLHTDMQATQENIRAAVRHARRATEGVEEQVFIAGDIGPIPRTGEMDDSAIEEQYYEIAKTFVEEGIAILTFETFADMEHILPAIQRIRQENDTFVMVQFSVNQFGYSNAGLSARKLLTEAAAVQEIDAIGLNCGVGPGHMEQILNGLYPYLEVQNKFLIALPNAGYPKRIRNQLQFANHPDYYADKLSSMADTLGLDILGGCCGTNPHFIQELVKKANTRQFEITKKAIHMESKAQKIRHVGFFEEENGTIKNKKLIAVELAPPANADDEKLLEAAYILQKSDVDVLTFPDSPSGRTRIDSVLMAEKVRRETGMCVMPHICCRDKNAIAMRSLFLGAHINDINNMLIVTGDPVPSMVRETVKAVFNFDSVGLMNIAKDMNEESFSNCPIVFGGAINQGRRNLEVEIKRVQRKMEAGAQFFFTQPVFSKEAADRVRRIKEETGARILCGIMPLISKRNALFMKNEIAGIAVTDELIDRYPENATREEGEAVGVAIAQEVMKYTQEFVDGYYFSFPFNRVYLLEKILKN
ncbi:MAG: bifunctional homocysteine S-methyltransferase/methylenetetrahydrofolate reductase [Lachnospiraceae bacterium]|nr:bifunctional homocysteine S-methyltransferase/methylenetetrahydrofolate reductase [Lachnospiraceae bacterium]